MRAGIVVTARDESTRLPKKHLMDLGGRALLGRLVDRLGTKYPVMIAVTPRSMELRTWIVENRRGVYFNSEIPDDDVTLRVLKAAEVCQFNPIIHINGDSPWIDEAMVTEALDYYTRNACDILTNRAPSGFRWKIASLRALKAAAEPREHVLASLIAAYGLKQSFVTHWYTPGVKFSVDTQEDLDFARAIGAAIGYTAPVDDVIATGLALRRHPDVREGDATGYPPVHPPTDRRP